jgi:uncharacterized protein
MRQSDGFAMAVVVEGSLTLAALLLAWLFQVPLRDRFPTTSALLFARIVHGLAATLPMLAVFWWLVNSQRRALRQLREQVEWLIGEMFPSASVMQFAMVATLAGVGEELLFRGVLQSKIGDWTTPLTGLMITSLLFGLAHALSKLYFVIAVAVSVFLGWLAWKYDDLIAPIIAHGVYDFLALTYLSKRITWRSDEREDPNSSTPIEHPPTHIDESMPQ